MSADRMVNVRLYDADNGVEWKGQLPASTQLYALTDLLYENKLKPFQRIGSVEDQGAGSFTVGLNPASWNVVRFRRA